MCVQWISTCYFRTDVQMDRRIKRYYKALERDRIAPKINSASWEMLGRDSSVGTATRHGMDGADIESQ
jgi:hypothetical protein